MRWFKLLSSWYSDDWVQSLASKFGSRGRDWYIICLSLVAQSMDGSDRCARSISWSELRGVLGFDRARDFLPFALFCKGHIDFSFTLSNGQTVKVCDESANSLSKVCEKSGPSLFKVCLISVPKLLKYKDEFSKKSGQTPVQDRDRDREKDQNPNTLSFQPVKDGQQNLPSVSDDGFVERVFRAWQESPGVTKSRRMAGHEGPIRSAVEYAGNPDRVILAIQRYSHVLVNAGGKYRQVYEWGINDFLSRRGHYNLDRFTGDAWENEFLAWSTGRKFKSIGELTEGL